MSQIFHPSSNTLSRVSIFGALFFLAALAFTADAVHRSAWVTGVDVAVEQPVPFSHKHHVQGLGLDCRYCHTSVEVAASAGMPSTKVCMTCHSQVWTESEMLLPVRESFRSDESLEWIRVHDLPDFVYFDHSVHVAKGVGCQSCHGNVNEMPLMWKENPLQMDWCLGCHRDPITNLRPAEFLFQTGSDVPEFDRATLEAIAHEKGVQSLTNCSICHR